MSERKVLNKYYPPDFDPSKIPRMKLAKNRQYTVRLMAPFNMRCKTCGEYIYKGKKFNARKEDVENETYLGIRIYRFYIKCTRCLQEISFKTDPQNTDYEIEAGATRNFMALKLAEEQARREEEEAREEEANNPMKLLENRTQQSRNEIEMLESLEELRDLNRRQQTVNYDSMLQQYNNVETEHERLEREEREDEAYIKSVQFRHQPKPGGSRIVAEEIIEEIEHKEDDKSNNFGPPAPKISKPDVNTVNNVKMGTSSSSTSSSGSSSSGVGKNLKLSNLVRRKEPLVLVKPKVDAKVNVEPEKKSLEQPTQTSKDDINENITSKSSNNESSKVGGLSLLAAYTDSSEDADSN